MFIIKVVKGCFLYRIFKIFQFDIMLSFTSTLNKKEKFIIFFNC